MLAGFKRLKHGVEKIHNGIAPTYVSKPNSPFPSENAFPILIGFGHIAHRTSIVRPLIPVRILRF